MASVGAKGPKISKALQKIFLKSSPPKEFEEWCLEKSLLVPMDIALLAKDEDAIESQLLNACKTKVTNVTEPASRSPSERYGISVVKR